MRRISTSYPRPERFGLSLSLAALCAACGSSGSGPIDANTSDASQFDGVPGCDSGGGVSAADAGPPPTALVYLIAGQSNAVGGARSATLPDEMESYADPFPMKYAEEINAPKDGTGGPPEISTGWSDDVKPREDGTFGIELSAARRLEERLGSGVAIIKHATNGSNLWGDWDSGDPNSLWQYMNEFVDARLAELAPGAVVAGLFWIQGNGDAELERTADDYAENLGWMIMRLRRKYGCVPVVIDRLHPGTSYLAGDNVRAEQDQVAMNMDNVVVVETDDLTLRDDPPVHYSAEASILLGERMADAMLSCP